MAEQLLAEPPTGAPTWMRQLEQFEQPCESHGDRARPDVRGGPGVRCHPQCLGLREVLSQLHSLAELPPTTQGRRHRKLRAYISAPRSHATRPRATATQREAELLAYTT